MKSFSRCLNLLIKSTDCPFYFDFPPDFYNSCGKDFYFSFYQKSNTTYINYDAENPNTSAHILRKLIKHTCDNVRRSVVKNPSTPKDVLIELIQQSYFKLGHFAYQSYKKLSTLAYEYPNFPTKELYKVLLDREIAEENKKSVGYIVNNHKNIPQFKYYISKNKDIQNCNYSSVKPDIRPEY